MGRHQQPRQRYPRTTPAEDRNRVVVYGAIGVVVCAAAGYIVTPSPPHDAEPQSKEEFLQRMRSGPSQAVYE
jgi:hypothetical protein